MTWLSLDNLSQLDSIHQESFKSPIVIFKHSTSCSISSMSKLRLESSWDFDWIKIFYLDLLSFRSVSDAISEQYQVHHESPQIILIYKGECIYDASHFDISTTEIKETLEYHNISYDSIA